MSYTGKRTGRTSLPKQISIDPDFLREVEALAVMNFRSTPQQLLYLAVKGLEHVKTCEVHAFNTEQTQDNASSRKVTQRPLITADGEPRKVKSA